jgi:hypothetical protein
VTESAEADKQLDFGVEFVSISDPAVQQEADLIFSMD